MGLFRAYLRSRSTAVLVFAAFFAVFAASFALYRLPLKAVIYPAFICILFGIIFMLLDYAKVRRSHKQFLEISQLTASMISSLPEPESVSEADCQTIVRALKAEVAAIETASAARYQDMVEYYTVWAHQIKTPIASMRLTLQNEDTPLSRRLISDLFRIEQYAEMVLTFLRLDSSSSDYVFREHDIDTVIRGVVRKYASEFIGRKIKLEYEPVSFTAVTDEKWLSFVIGQVLSNALKYTREGSIKIYRTGVATLCIEDTGIGIAPEDMPRIFEKGYTGCNGRSDKSASGIGLYLCARVCKKLGAKICASSEPGKGTAIYIDLEQYKLKAE